ncbi:Veg family protein [Mediannikoviicoccus vaginalis]|uniref:Veg family protein n=1 Tax=Mediannikoviicoccus vaginalis TaxID=2899727 RepID=UPI0021081C41|nr:Veg family protein [Mediannikoviicoccus vaginalis]
MSKYMSLEVLKNQVEENIGKKVVIKADKGRNKIITKTGVIENVFPSLFTIKITNEFEQERTISFTYSDLLTSTVELQLC